MNKEKLEKILFSLLAIVMVGYFAYSMIVDPFKHIEDRNGENNSAIATITNSEIIDYGNSRSGGMSRSKTDFVVAGIQLGGIKFHSDKFSGIEPLLRTNVIFGDILLNIYNLEVNAGNFRLYVLNEGKIIDVIDPEDEFDHFYENVKGEFVVVAVGESADFKFEMNTTEYNEYYHFAWE